LCHIGREYQEICFGIAETYNDSILLLDNHRLFNMQYIPWFKALLHSYQKQGNLHDADELRVFENMLSGRMFERNE
jgi:hypothetical protein